MSEGRTVEPVVIAGGGYGGLACVLGLAIKGFRVVVLDRSQEFGKIGAAVGAVRCSKRRSERSLDDERAATRHESPVCIRGQRATASRLSPM